MTSTSTRTEPPRADCIADSAGGITFDIVGDASPGAVLVLRRRGGKTAADVMRLPLTPAGEGRLRAVLPSTVELGSVPPPTLALWWLSVRRLPEVPAGLETLRTLEPWAAMVRQAAADWTAKKRTQDGGYRTGE